MWLLRVFIISLWTSAHLTSSEEEATLRKNHRQKRFLWMTQEKRLVLPPGTQLVLTPTLAMPLLRYPPSGLDANLTISTPFTRNDFSTTVVIFVTETIASVLVSAELKEFRWPKPKSLLSKHF